MVGWTGLPPNFEAQMSIGGCHISPLPPPRDRLNVPRDMRATDQIVYGANLDFAPIISDDYSNSLRELSCQKAEGNHRNGSALKVNQALQQSNQSIAPKRIELK